MNQRNQSKLAIALLAAFAALSPSLANACDQCDSKTSCATCSQCDDRGLLDIVDIVAGRMHASIKQAVPKINVRCSCKLRKSSGCDNPSCGVESPSCGCAAPACGVETPSCGVERPSCGCDACGTEMPFGNTDDQAIVYPEAITEPPTQYSPLPAPAPTPNLGPVPVPDHSVDPFMDDSASRVRRVPARNIQYRKPANRYGESYDPQAFNSYRVRLSDDTPAFETAGSSRRQATARVAHSEPSTQSRTAEPTPAVVTASSQSPVATVPSTSARPLPRVSTPASNVVNPLRGNN